jgi:alanyl-tRNA synthetase
MFTHFTEPTVEYIFESCKGKVIALRYDNKIVETLTSGQECGLILDQTNFYAESGGQIYDQGYLIKVEDESTEFSVRVVYNKGGYILYIGTVEGTLSVSDEVQPHLDSARRQLTMKNHSPHALNYPLLKVFGNDIDQRGLLVVPEKLRFDFTSKNAMTIQQVAAAGKFTLEVVKKNVQIFAKEADLKVAKSIYGLRSVFDEVYPEPVRVISFGVSVEELEKNPQGVAGVENSVEFCGGTHPHQSGHMVDYARRNPTPSSWFINSRLSTTPKLSMQH